MNSMTSGLAFLIESLFFLAILVLMLRFLFPILRVNYANQFVQSILQLTNPVVVPLMSFIPNFRGIELSTFALVWCIAILKYFIIQWVLIGSGSGVMLLPIIALFSLARALLDLFFFSILLVVLLSYLSTSQYNPLSELLHDISEPVVAPIRRVLPTAGILDFSPLVAMLLIKLIDIVVLTPIA
jgi:YggT family protein